MIRYLSIAATLLLALGACKADNNFADAGIDPDASGADASTDLPNVEFPTDLAIGLVDCGASGTFTYDVENTGGGDLDYDISSTNASVFSVSPSSGTLIAGTTTTFTLTATMPADASPGTEVVGDLRITSDALAVDHIVNLHAAPRGGVLTLSPTAAGFGDVEFGLSGNRFVTVENSGNAPVNVTIADPTDAEFAVSFVDGRVLANGASRNATVTYTPSENGPDSATAAVLVTGPTCGTVPTSLSMSANGIPDGGVIVTGNLAFGTVTCGAVEDSEDLTLYNDGNVPATFTAALADDPDAWAYTVSPGGGTIPVGGTAIVTVTREQLALPVDPGNYNLNLLVNTTGQVVINRTIPISQVLSGPFLEIDLVEGDGGYFFDFGYAPNSALLSKPIVVSNTGNALANNAMFVLVVPATDFSAPEDAASIAAAANATFHADYQTVTPGLARSGEVRISAPGQCSATISVKFDAGEGPWMSIYSPQEINTTCGGVQEALFGLQPRSYLYFTNLGTEPLDLVECSEEVATINPTFELSGAQNVGAGGGSGWIGLAWADPVPLLAATTPTTLRCDTNEPFYEVREFDVNRVVYGANLTITQPDGPFDFDCTNAPGTFKRVTIQNTGNQATYLSGSGSAPPPLQLQGLGFNLGSGTTDATMGVGFEAGGCFQGSGSFQVVYGNSNVCSTTGETDYPVTLTGPAPN